MKRPGQSGLTLLGAILLVFFASLVVLSTSVFIIERLRQEEVYQLRTKCVYLSQAGIQRAAYNYRLNDLAANGYFSLGQFNIDPGNFFVLGGDDADLLMVNTAASNIGGASNRDLLGLLIQNATNSRAITIDRMIVTWDNARRLQQIVINGSTVFNGNLSSPANANIANFTLNTTPTIYSINRLRFNGSMAGANISIQFLMTDGSTRTVSVYPASQNNSFTVKSTGKKTGSNAFRTIRADYNAITARITSYDEIATEITP